MLKTWNKPLKTVKLSENQNMKQIHICMQLSEKSEGFTIIEKTSKF